MYDVINLIKAYKDNFKSHLNIFKIQELPEFGSLAWYSRSANQNVCS